MQTENSLIYRIKEGIYFSNRKKSYIELSYSFCCSIFFTKYLEIDKKEHDDKVYWHNKLSGIAEDKRQLKNFPIYHITKNIRWNCSVGHVVSPYAILNLFIQYLYSSSLSNSYDYSGRKPWDISLMFSSTQKNPRNNATVRKRQDTL